MDLSKNDNLAPFYESFADREAFVKSINKLFSEATDCILNTALHDGTFFRPLLKTEEKTLSDICHCQSSDWSKILLWIPKERKPEQCASSWLRKNVSFNTFEGVVVINVGDSLEERALEKENQCALPPGIHFNMLLSNCILDRQSKVYHNRVVKDTYIGVNATVVNNGQIYHSSNASQYGTLKISVGPESGGGREVTPILESTIVDICQQLKMSLRRRKTVSRNPSLSCYNLIGKDCIVRDTPTVEDILLLPNSRIEASCSIRSVVLMPTAAIGNAVTAVNTLLQWNTSIEHSNVINVLLMEHAHVGPKSIVQDSILGPDVHVSAGEVHASVIGPNTNAHHQSLVISVLWPLGRGNVGYGANVGSNHTGRLPDQETIAAEGTFWGLSTVIKFPVNMSAPYSIVAAGTTLAPQHISMPFSLLVDQGQECNIIPGWVLYSSPYTISRSETKFATRRNAKRHAWYSGWKIMRPYTIDLIIASRRALERESGLSEYRNIPGIGKATLSEKARKAGIAAYTTCIRRYALLGLFERCLESMDINSLQLSKLSGDQVSAIDLGNPSWPVLPWDEDQNLCWNHQQSLLLHEFKSIKVSDLLSGLVQIEKEHADNIWKSKSRDDIRGSKIVPGYSDSHINADEDRVVKAAIAQANYVREKVETILLEVEATRSRL